MTACELRNGAVCAPFPDRARFLPREKVPNAERFPNEARREGCKAGVKRTQQPLRQARSSPATSPCTGEAHRIGLPQRFCKAKDLREESEGAKGEGRRLTATREARERATDGRMIKKGLHFFYGCDIMLRGK